MEDVVVVEAAEPASEELILPASLSSHEPDMWVSAFDELITVLDSLLLAKLLSLRR